MKSRGKHRIASLVVVALLTATVPLGVPGASAAEVGATGITTGTLRSVAFVSATTGFAAADNGVIMKTTDGGNSWTQVRAADSYSLRGIDFWNETSGVAVDYAGRVTSTTNGGATWTNVDFGYWPDMDEGDAERTHHDVACQPGGTAAITAAGDPSSSDENWIGATSMRTSGNLRWWQNPAAETKPHRYYNAGDQTYYDVGEGEFLDVEYVGSSTVWASGIDYWILDANNPTKYPLFKSVDGGINYTRIGFGTANLRFESVAFGSATAGIVVGQLVGSSRRAYYTTNGGTTWTSASSLPGTSVLTAVDMSSATQGWAVSTDGTIIRTTDGGATWTACTISPTNYYSLYDVKFLPGTTYGWAVGASGTVLITTDGVNWGPPVPPDVTPPTLSPISSTTHPVQASWYPSRTVAASWTAVDASGVSGYAVVRDQNASTVPAATITQTENTYAATLSTDGIWYLHVRAVDSKGNWSSTQHYTFRADTADPTTTSDVAGPYAGSAPITLSPSDPSPSSGIAETYWSLDGGPSGTGTSFTITDEGDRTLRFHSVDGAGNAETEKTASFTLEIAPTLSAIDSDSHPDPDAYAGGNEIRASWTGSDSSGLEGYAVVLDHASDTVPATVSQTADTFAQTVAVGGEWYLHVRAKDTRGNWSQTEHRRFLVDFELPVLSPLESTTHPDSDAWYTTSSVSASWTASDAAGIDGYSVVFDDVATTVPDITVDQTENTYAGTLTADGVRYLHVRAKDSTDQWSVTQHYAFRRDTVKPSTTSNAVASYAGSASITLVPADAAPSSGIAQTYWSIDGGGSGTGTTIEVAAEGTWTLRFHSVDTAGNVETEKSAVFAVEIPPAAPVIASSTHPDQDETYPVPAFAANWSASDSSGIAGYAVKIDTNPATVPAASVTQTGSTFTGVLSRSTIGYIHVRARDSRGNWSGAAHYKFTIAPLTVTRVEGADRYATAIAASAEGFPSGITTSVDGYRNVVIATGRNWPDALGGAALAGALECPILLTEPSALSPAVADEIERLGATRVVILGGEAAVSTTVAAAIDAIPGVSVKRVAGADRYVTATEVARETVRILEASPAGYDGTAFVATGANFPDALGASPVAAAQGWPLYLVNPAVGVTSSLESALERDGVTHVVALGGTAVVTDAVLADLRTRVGATTERWWGEDRYATAIDVATHAVDDWGLTWNKVAIATGANFPDALSGGALQRGDRSVMLLTPPTSLYAGIDTTLRANKGSIGEVRFLGGTAAVTQAVRDSVAAALQ